MHTAFGRLTVVALVAACARPTAQRASQPATADRGRVDRNVLTQAQLGGHQFNTAYDAVEALRGNWLNTRGTDSFQSPSHVRVYLDNVSLGDVQTLRNISLPTVVYLRFYDGISATARWGLDHGAGVIFVSTRPASVADPSS